MAHIWIAAALTFFVVAAVTEGKLITDRVKNVAYTLAVSGVFFSIISLSQSGANQMIWLGWAIGTLISGFVLYVIGFWLHARFELPAGRHSS